MNFFARAAFACVAALSSTVPLAAHDPGLSTLSIDFGADKIAIRLILTQGDLATLKADPNTLAAQAVAWTNANSDAPLRPTAVRSNGNEHEFDYEAPREPGTVQSLLVPKLPFGHRQLVTVQERDGTRLRTNLLTAEIFREVITAEDLARTAPAEPVTSIGSFFRLGVEHILTGYDHLLFLLGILLVCTRFGPAVQIITCFTLAHSLTLAAVTFGWFQVPGHIVEPLIAASILYIGLENLFLTQTLRRRCVLTFAFGLIHGMGFAGALIELGVGRDGRSILAPLAGFNLGVEAGQIAVAAIVLPVLLALRSRPVFLARGVPALSLLVALAGGYWLVTRTLLS